MFPLLFCFHLFSVIWNVFWYSSFIFGTQLAKLNTKFTPRSRFPHPKPWSCNIPSRPPPQSHNIDQYASYPNNKHSHSTHDQRNKFPPLTCYNSFQIIIVSSNYISPLYFYYSSHRIEYINCLMASIITFGSTVMLSDLIECMLYWVSMWVWECWGKLRVIQWAVVMRWTGGAMSCAGVLMFIISGLMGGSFLLFCNNNNSRLCGIRNSQQSNFKWLSHIWQC